MKNKKNRVWHYVRYVKDMPKKTGDYLMLTDMGWPLTFFWDSHCREAYILSNRNHYDIETNTYVDDGKVDNVRLDLREHKGFAWTKIPEYDGE